MQYFCINLHFTPTYCINLLCQLFVWSQTNHLNIIAMASLLGGLKQQHYWLICQCEDYLTSQVQSLVYITRHKEISEVKGDEPLTLGSPTQKLSTTTFVKYIIKVNIPPSPEMFKYYPSAANFEDLWWSLQTIWIQMRPHKMWGLIWDLNCETQRLSISKNLDEKICFCKFWKRKRKLRINP